MGSIKGLGILTGARSSFLDHLVPLCHLMNIPLYCTDRWVAELADIFYPPLEQIKTPNLKDYSTFFYVQPARTAHGSFYFDTLLYQGKARSVCGLHGNSEKNLDTFWVERLTDEDLVLLYGEFLIQSLKEKGVFSRMPSCVVTGNYRQTFYEKHREFFDQICQSHLFSTKKITVLYAPTWTYPDRRERWNSSFFDVYPYVLDHIPDEFQVLVKLHPFYFYLYPREVEELKERYSANAAIHFLDEIPLVYPFLDKVDIYLGDYSSVGYDFLFYNRPLFFINSEKKTALSQCGKVLSISELPYLYQILRKETQEDLSSIRKAFYHHAFAPSKPFDLLRKEIEEGLG